MRLRPIVAVGITIVACAVLVGATVRLSSGRGGEARVALDAGPGNAVLVMDGWSRAILGEPPTWGDNGRAGQAAAWHDLTADEADQLLETDPAAVAALMARLVVAVPVPTCDRNGCRSGDTRLPLDYLTDPGSIPGYGEMYDAWGIRPVQVAQVSLAPGSSSLVLGAGDVTTLPVTVVARSSPDVRSPVTAGPGLDVPEPPVPGLSVPGLPSSLAPPTTTTTTTSPPATGPSPTTGPGDALPRSVRPGDPQTVRPNVVVMAAAFGTLFPLEPRWSVGRGGAGGQAYTSAGGIRFDIDPGAVAGLRAGESPLGKGLAETVSGAAAMPASMRTALSSPTTGCLGVVVCAPGPVDVTVDGAAALAVERCDSASAPGFASAPPPGFPRLRTAVVVRDETWTLDLPHPIAQAGAWGGRVPASPVAGIWGPGPMPLYDGEHPLRVKTALVYTDDGDLAAIGGQIFEVGVDRPSDVDGPWGLSEALASLGAGRFTECPAPGAPTGYVAPPSTYTPPIAAPPRAP